MLEAYDDNSDPTEHVAAFYPARPKPIATSLLGMRQKEEEHLGQYLARFTDESHEPSLRPKGSMEWHIDIIVGGPTVGGVGSSTRKAYARMKVHKRPRPRGNPGFTFESESEYPDHDDALVVTARIANTYIRRIMIDIRSSIDILYLDVFHKL
ncbi:hypothetical protein GW17_00026632 [Ensete ventricosum]|nr:hypothetical protein GW17_00026632 [Ensete ventricosum]